MLIPKLVTTHSVYYRWANSYFLRLCFPIKLLLFFSRVTENTLSMKIYEVGEVRLISQSVFSEILQKHCLTHEWHYWTQNAHRFSTLIEHFQAQDTNDRSSISILINFTHNVRTRSWTTLKIYLFICIFAYTPSLQI